MNWSHLDRYLPAALFAFALILYALTVAPTVSFWDPGERIAVSSTLQIPHPPGAPFYMLVGRLFSMFVPASYVALSMNMISVLASAAAVTLTYLIVLQLIREWRGPKSTWTPSVRVTAYVGGLVGALTLAVSDSFWFNAVEAETYALSTFFTTLCVWLTLKWSEYAQAEDRDLARGVKHVLGSSSERWLLVVAYLYGLAIGIHLLSLLSLFFVALIVFFQRYDNPDWSAGTRFQYLALAGGIASGIFFLLYPGIIQGLPTVLEATQAPFLVLTIMASLLVYGLYITHTKRMRVANLLVLYVVLGLIGYSSYFLIPIRSSINPPIDQNNPSSLENFVSYMSREQYGDRPLLSGSTYNDETGRVERDAEALFPRRWSPNPRHTQVYDRYNSDLDFFLRYQIGHMYTRYFLWNFAGRAADTQDAPAATGISFLDPDIANEATVEEATPSERAGRSVYFALPLLLGLFGAFYHFTWDWRRATAVAFLFFITGIGIIIYLNQTPMQPRERDYSYAGSFFAFSIWVGLGATGLLHLLKDSLFSTWSKSKRWLGLAAAGALLLATVPGWMLYQNYDSHDRSGRYLPSDYAYNMLNSVAPNAILFTNGDNDTFPLWYLQEVEGVRRDVRVVNLSLLNTPWYIKQLKNQQAHESEPLPFSFSDEQIEELRPRAWRAQPVSIPVDSEAVIENGTVADSDSARVSRPLQWQLEGRPFDERSNMLQIADLAVFDLIRSNAENDWSRPVYFAVTVAQSGRLNLDDYLQLEGQAYRIVPVQHDQRFGRVVPDITIDRMQDFRFRGLADPDVYYDENARRMADGYRLFVTHAAEQWASSGHEEEARAFLDDFVEQVPFGTIAGNLQSYVLTAQAYESMGATDRVAEIMTDMEPMVFQELQQASSTQDFLFALRFAGSVRMSYQEADRPDRVEQFDTRFEELRRTLPYDIPVDILRDYGLTDSASPDPEGLLPGTGGDSASAPAVPPAGGPPQP
ncbi:membrane protein [Longimonas halophila]|uniref:Membrane protein n=1 Tax=Longimonas halophila TaxID=1469170 RepID=A0A2H3P5K8_9BACT|nr:DUF2723 domain-containing protein [Longimonas halophila]PEN06045.1 membrane protein [Longimonas halophila]